jgi:hypothetical protein
LAGRKFGHINKSEEGNIEAMKGACPPRNIFFKFPKRDLKSGNLKGNLHVARQLRNLTKFTFVPSA